MIMYSLQHMHSPTEAGTHTHARTHTHTHTHTQTYSQSTNRQRALMGCKTKVKPNPPPESLHCETEGFIFLLLFHMPIPSINQRLGQVKKRKGFAACSSAFVLHVTSPAGPLLWGERRLARWSRRQWRSNEKIEAFAMAPWREWRGWQLKGGKLKHS